MFDEEADDTGDGEGTDPAATRSRREMLGTAGIAALGGATVAMSASKVPGMLARPPVERDEIGRYSHRSVRPGPCEIRWCASVNRDAVALTFDDGPDPDITPRVLRSLARHRITATFFVVAALAEAHRSLLEQIVEAGHEIGNHSWSHLEVVDLDQDATDREIGDAQESLESMTGIAPRWYRPPRGQVTGAVMSSAARNGLDVAMWTQRFGVEDPADPPELGPLLGGMRAGDFVLVHDGVVESLLDPISKGAFQKRRRRMADAAALDELLERLTGEGWQFDTVSALVDFESGA